MEVRSGPVPLRTIVRQDAKNGKEAAMPAPIITRASVWEDSGVTFMARIIDTDGNAVVQADVSGITWKLFDLNSDNIAAPTASGTLTVSATVYDTLQTDSRWTVDSTGFNFLDTRTPSQFPTGNTTYRYEALFDPATGEDFFVVFEVSTLRVYSS